MKQVQFKHVNFFFIFIQTCFASLLLHRAFRRITLIITNKCTYIKFHIKTHKIAPTCFDPKIILRELRKT